jgi:NOL1/NOP2/sun family putative RNA methylase
MFISVLDGSRTLDMPIKAHDLKPIPGTETLEFKPRFIERYSKLTDWETYRRYSLAFLRKSIRVNTLKTSIAECLGRLRKDFRLEPVPWCPEGFFIEHKEGRLDVGNTLEHALGYYYVQEAASMIPPVVLDPQPGEAVLDMAAAPGSKASQAAQLMLNTGVLVANDIAGARLAALGVNLTRMGVMNTVTTQMPGQRLAGLQFDRVLLDAPCSGTGTIRKSLKTIQIWNPDMVRRIAVIQRKMIDAAFRLLRPGGTLVYSTCSTEPEEDEAVVDWLLRKHEDADTADIDLPLQRGTPVLAFEGQQYDERVSRTLRLWPQDNDTEGFYVAKIVKR